MSLRCIVYCGKYHLVKYRLLAREMVFNQRPSLPQYVQSPVIHNLRSENNFTRPKGVGNYQYYPDMVALKDQYKKSDRHHGLQAVAKYQLIPVQCESII